jgi:hypothetical protein
MTQSGRGSFGGAYSINGGDKYYIQILSPEMLYQEGMWVILSLDEEEYYVK